MGTHLKRVSPSPARSGPPTSPASRATDARCQFGSGRSPRRLHQSKNEITGRSHDRGLLLLQRRAVKSRLYLTLLLLLLLTGCASVNTVESAKGHNYKKDDGED